MKKLIYIITFCLLTVFLSGCSKETKFTAYSMDYFDTVTTITGYGKSKEEFDKISGEMIELLGQYHRLYSIYHRFEGIENLATVNEIADGAHRTVKVDKRIIDMLLYAKEIYRLTDGTMNIAMGSVLSLWHEYRTIGKDNPIEASLPPMELLEEAKKHTDISKMVIDEENCTVTLSDPLMKLDVGAIAKGYAVERVAQHFEEKGVSGYVINVGGNVCTIGTKADGTNWTIGVEAPDADNYLAYLSLNGQSVVTSGSYQRYYFVDGKAYHHIIDPETLMPAENYLSVSIISNHSGLGDGLSTALFCMPLEKGLKLIDSLENTEAMWVTKDGKTTCSSGWKNFEKQN